MFAIEGKEYDLKFNLKRIQLIENTLGGKSFMSMAKETGGLFGITELMTMTAFALRESGEDMFVPYKKGMEIAEELLCTKGYEAVCEAVLEQIQKDCPFFFRAG